MLMLAPSLPKRKQVYLCQKKKKGATDNLPTETNFRREKKKEEARRAWFVNGKPSTTILQKGRSTTTVWEKKKGKHSRRRGENRDQK